MLAEEREREEETRVAAATSRDNEEPSLKQLLDVVQQLQGEIVAMKKRGGRKGRSRADNGTTQSQNEATPPQRTADGRPICFYCKAEGHIKRYCPKKKEDDDRRNNTTVAMISTSDEEDDKEIPLLQIDAGQLLTEEVTIGTNDTEKKTEAVIDTVAAVSIISPKLTAEMALEFKTWGGPQIVMVNGQRTPPLGRVELTITIGTTTVQAKVLVLQMGGINLLLGNDVLRRFKKLEIEYGKGKPKMRFGDLPVRMAIEDETPTPATKIVAKSGARIPARSMAAVEIEQIEATKPTVDGCPWMIEPATNRTSGPTPGRAQMPGDRTTVWVMKKNLENRSVYIHKKMVLGHRTEVAGIDTEIHATGRANGPRTLNTELDKGTTNILDFTPSINQELLAEERYEFEYTLRDNSDCFAREGERLGRCNVAEHEIQLTPNARPIYQTQRPASWKEQAIHKELTLDMLKKGVIEEATRPWSTRTLLIQKKDGSWRFCLDFRPLNNVTILSRTCRRGTGRSRSTSRIGLKPLSITADGLFEFKVMPFGLTNAPATFQRMMDVVLAGIKWNSCLVYLDDIVVFAPTVSQHLERLGEGISPDPEKISAVRDFPVPRNVKEVQSFLGLCSYYRRFVPNFAVVARPLSNMTKKNQRFSWGEEHQRSFEAMKTILISPPTLAHPRYDLPMEIHCDASNYGVGAVLVQKHGDEEHVIAYASRLLSDPEINYSVSEKERLALVWSVRKFRSYIWGLKIRDGSSFYLLAIEETGFVWEACAKEKEIPLLNVTVVAGAMDIGSDQRESLWWEGILRGMKDTAPTLRIKKLIQPHELRGDVLYRHRIRAGVVSYQLCLPKSLVEQVLLACHSDVTVGHLGVTCTTYKIQQRYYWPGMRRQITRFYSLKKSSTSLYGI
ncbi:Uncharacterized protein APZ42_033842 [Daphnia magna]|uniref:RNA-directed DNA polymerase n=1 Tax=Daphnia magna TaxID=35525 RepID=A0A164KML9_9CRUS|nr:Uncharacterized protein APZ42_033842 [Daphnia magna]